MSSHRIPLTFRRRRFIGLLSGSALSAGLPLLLAGCGGGGRDGGSTQDPGPEDPGGGGDPTPADPADAARLEAIADVEQHCRDLESQELTPLAYVTAVAAYMSAQPIYAMSGVEEGALTAWGLFEDGRMHIVTRSRMPVRESAAAVARTSGRAQALAARVEVPASRHARLMHSFGANFEGQGTVAQLSSMLSKNGYLVRQGAEGDARLTTLRAVQGDGFFYINSHGGATPRVLRNDKEMPSLYSVQSSTPVSAATEAMPDVRDDLANLRLTYHTGATGNTVKDRWGRDVPEMATRYGITAHFVDKYWKFAQHSVVIINACNSANTSSAAYAAGFIFACHRKGAGVYLGWTQTVSGEAAYSAPPYFVDRLLGANVIDPESPKQRAFPWDDVMDDMQAKGRTRDPVTGSFFVAKPRPGSPATSILAPTIHHVEVDERANELRLVGRFGTRAGKVFVDSTERALRSWTDELVVCDLPASGAGSRGGVFVKVDEHRSNVRQITEWRMPIDYRWLDQYHVGLRVDGKLQLRWRADVGPVRERPGEAPRKPVRFAIGARDSGMALSASGSYSEPLCSYAWSGDADFGSQLDAIEGDTSTDGRFIFANLRVDTHARKGNIGLAMAADGGMFTETNCSGSHEFTTALGLLDSVVEFEVVGAVAKLPLPALSVDFGSDFTILGGTHLDDELRLRWSDVKPSFPPLADDAV
jgi:hypothetical protein